MDVKTSITAASSISSVFKRYVDIASHQYQEGIRLKLDPKAAWNDSNVDWITAARVSSNCCVCWFGCVLCVLCCLHDYLHLLHIMSGPLPLGSPQAVSRCPTKLQPICQQPFHPRLPLLPVWSVWHHPVLGRVCCSEKTTAEAVDGDRPYTLSLFLRMATCPRSR